MASVNERLQRETISHAVDLLHYSNNVVRRIISTLNKADKSLASALMDALDRLPAESFTVERLERILASVRELNLKAYRAVEKELTSELRDFSATETRYQQKLFTAAIPAQVVAEVGIASVAPAQVYAAAMARPFQGRVLSEWSASMEASRMTRIRDAIRIGYVSGEATQQIISRIIGTRAKKYSDGIIEGDRRHVAAVVRTALGHTAAVARKQMDDGNDGLIKGYVWVATLDSRTSAPCRLRDGLRYDLEHNPVGHSVPWGAGPGAFHWNCRSTESRVLKSLREMGLDVDDFKPSTRASMDGQVPADMSYADWLKDQSAARQDEVLGPTRGRAFRAGDVGMSDLYDHKGRFLTLDELSARGIDLGDA